jgi:chemotaxis protein CheX
LRLAFIQNFAKGTLKTLKVQCATDARAQKPVVKQRGMGGDTAIAAIIGLNSDHFEGSLALCFPEQTYLKIMTGMLGEEQTVLDNDLADGVSELLNIVFGFTKKQMNDQLGTHVRMAIPTVIRAESVNVVHCSSGGVVMVPFESGAGHFHIEVALDEIKPKIA